MSSIPLFRHVLEFIFWVGIFPIIAGLGLALIAVYTHPILGVASPLFAAPLMVGLSFRGYEKFKKKYPQYFPE